MGFYFQPCHLAEDHPFELVDDRLEANGRRLAQQRTRRRRGRLLLLLQRQLAGVGDVAGHRGEQHHLVGDGHRQDVTAVLVGDPVQLDQLFLNDEVVPGRVVAAQPLLELAERGLTRHAGHPRRGRLPARLLRPLQLRALVELLLQLGKGRAAPVLTAAAGAGAHQDGGIQGGFHARHLDVLENDLVLEDPLDAAGALALVNGHKEVDVAGGVLAAAAAVVVLATEALA